MKATGIIVEYNPLHYGHLYHLKKAREITNCDVLIAIMSGNFTQRGEPAIIDKWARTEAALKNGIDLVIELPFIYSTQSAKQFAEGALHFLNLAQIKALVFGSETNNLTELKEISQMSINPNNLKELLNQGYSYPKAYGLMAGSYGANDILGISYLQAINNRDIKPYSIQRLHNNYHDTKLTERFSSSTAIREQLRLNHEVSKLTPMSDSLNQSEIKSLEDYFPFIRHQLLTLTKEELANIHLMSEGIENHLIKQAFKYQNYTDFINNSTSRRYTKSRIQRILMQVFINLKKDEVQSLPPLNHLRVLGFNDLGQKYLKKIKKETDVKVITSFSRLPQALKNIEYRATIAYSLPYKTTYQNYLKERELLPPIILTKR